jgi:CDP-glucose 4,6-dehydratase
MAAQALVREGYRNPLYTYETNVLGTLNVLEAVEQTDSVRAQLMVTTDKVYLDQGLNRPYVETDPLGGIDPYSASKAMADILAQEFLSRESAKPGAVVRAGNVIGAGDVSADRLIPDLLRSAQGGALTILRYPAAVRPWQHVLDCLLGYLFALEYVTSHKEVLCLNFGPDSEGLATVGSVVEVVESTLGRKLTSSERDPQPDMGEAITLSLDSSLARELFAWSETMGLHEAIADAVALSGAESPRTVRDHIESKISDVGVDRV